MQTRIAAVEILDLRLLDRVDHLLGDEFDSVRNPGKMLEGVQEHSCARSQKVAALAGDDCPVGQFKGSRILTGLCLALAGGEGCPPVVGSEPGSFEDESHGVDFGFGTVSVSQSVERIVVPPDDFIVGRFAADLIILEAVAYHIHTHVRRRLVWVFAIYAFEDRIQDREYLDVPVVVDGGLSVGLKMERVDHVDILQVGSRSLVGEVDRMLQR